MAPMPTDRVKKAWFMAALMTGNRPVFSKTLLGSGDRCGKRPASAPGRVRERMTRAMRMKSRPSIISLTTRSTPFCTPMAHTPQPMSTTRVMPTTWVQGSPRVSARTCSTLAASRPLRRHGHVPAVIEHPARDRGVEHHQQVAADKGHLAAPVPLAALGLKDVEGQAHIAAGGTAHGEFHDHGRHHSRQAEQIDTHEDGANAPVM